MRYGNWVPISKGLLKYLPHDRPYSKVEAAYSLQNDIDCHNKASISGYSKLWGWSQKKVRNFLKNMGAEIQYSNGKMSPKGGEVGVQVGEKLRGKKGEARLINSGNLEDTRKKLRNGKGEAGEKLGHTTKESNPNPSLKDLSEPPLEAPPGGIISIPLKGSKTFTPTKEQLAEWQESFPGVDVPTELRKIKQWNIDNPRRRKTPTGIYRHICSWLGKEQEKAGPVPDCSVCDHKQRGYCAKTEPCNEFRPSTL